MIKNQEYTGDVLSLGSEGEGIIKCGDCTVFAPFCLDGERVRFKVLKVSGNVAYAKLLDVLAPSKDRVAPVCPQFERCGGCQLQHASKQRQLAFKRQTVINCLKKIGGLEPEVDECVSGDRQYGYRNKLTLPVGIGEDGNSAVGFYAPRSHRIVPIEGCPLQVGWSQFIISALKRFMQESGYKGYDERTAKGDIRHLVAREVGEKLIITVVAVRKINLDGFAKILAEGDKKFTLWLNVNASTGNAIFSNEWHICCGEGIFTAEDEGIKFEAGAATFLQVNDGVRSLLYRAVAEAACDSGAAVIDLYSGGGMLTAMLAKNAKAAYGAEIVPEAVACADRLKQLNNLNNKMFNRLGRVEELIDGILKETEGLDKIIVSDPPRKGMERSVVEAVKASGAKRVVLISCNPASLARDLGLLCGSLIDTDGGLKKFDGPARGPYKIDRVTPFDMFPQTKHAETLVTLSLAKE